MLGMGYDGLNVSHNPQNIRNLRNCKPHRAGITQREGERVAELDAGPIIDRMQQLLGVRTDIAVGAHFELGTSAVSGWRQRGKVPYEECVILAREKGVSLDWLLLGLGEMYPERGYRGVGEGEHEDPRMQRVMGFLANWIATRTDDDKTWLEMQLARNIPEYADWVARRTRG